MCRPPSTTLAGDEARDGAEEREVEDDSPGGLLHVAELLHLPVDDEVEERDARQMRAGISSPSLKLGCSTMVTPVKPAIVASTSAHGAACGASRRGSRSWRHEERRRVDEGHVGPEVHLSEREEPEHDRERAEDGTLMWPAMCGVLRVRVARLRKTKREITSTPKSER